MDFTLTRTQTDIKAEARRYLADRCPPLRVAELSDAGRHDDRWAELDRLGWLDHGLGLVELVLLAEEGGRALHPAPWWSTAGQVVPVYRVAGAELPGPATLADGSRTCAARHRSGGWLVTGHVADVVDARGATEIVVAAGTGSGVALFGVPAAAAALADRPGLDPLRPVSGVTLTDAPARLLVGPPSAQPVLAAAVRRATTLLAAEAVGVADRALEFGVEHARTRVQFGRPIGTYQAVAHPLAERYADVELARSLVYRAACVTAEAGDDVGTALACAVRAATTAAVRTCETAIQVAGGMGVTWEFPLHRWYRRALWLEACHARRSDPLGDVATALFDTSGR